MKFGVVCAAFLCLTLLSAPGFAAAHQYQAGKIVKVEKQESHSHSGGTDAAMVAEIASYHVSIQLGDKVYVCNYDTHSEHDISWVEGKDVEARVSGKVVYVKKANGKEANGAILSISHAGK
jgi:hypothetical protein